MSQALSVDDFIRKWRVAKLKESSSAQEDFLDLCALLDEPSPAKSDPTGATYCCERGAAKTGGGEGWADVWKRGHFGWEYTCWANSIRCWPLGSVRSPSGSLAAADPAAGVDLGERRSGCPARTRRTGASDARTSREGRDAG